MLRKVRRGGRRPSPWIAVAGVALAAATAGCGARTALDEEASNAGGPPAAECGPSMAEVGPLLPINDIEGGWAWAEVAADGDDLWIAVRGRVRVARGDLSSLGPWRSLLGYIHGIASGFGHRGAIGSDDDAGSQCIFVALGDDAAPQGAPTSLDADLWCTGLVATPGGFLTLGLQMESVDEDFRVMLLTLDPNGALVAKATLLSSEFRLAPNFARFDDGNLLLVWDVEQSQAGAPGAPVGPRAQAFTEAGEALAEPVDWQRSFEFAALSASGIVAYPTYSDYPNEVLVTRATNETGALGPEVLVGDGAEWLGTFDVARSPNGAIAVAVQDGDDRATLVHWLGLDGAPIGDRLRLEPPGASAHLRVEGTSKGAVIFEHHRVGHGSLSFQIFARALVCP